MNNLLRFNLETLPRISQFRSALGLQRTETIILSAVLVFDNHLAHLGILANDVLFVRPTTNFNEANLYVWRTPSGQMARYGRTTLAEITLHNGKEWKETFFRSEVEMLGVVVRVERDLKIRR